MYNFNEIISRENTCSLKWDGMGERLGLEQNDLMPMWVADMDFRTAPSIIDDLAKRVQHGIFGYSGGMDDYYEAVMLWNKRRHSLELKKEWIVFGGTLVNGLNRIIRTFTNKDEKIIVQSPVFSGFMKAIENQGREIVYNPLKKIDNKYFMDFDDLTRKIDSKTKMIILCNPHNPVGRVWSKEELRKLSEICIKNNIIIVSDEIHSDITFSHNTHTVFYSVSEEAADNCILLTSPHKSFNIAGLEISTTIIKNKTLRDKYVDALLKDGINKPNLMGLTAIVSAYTKGEPWLNELVKYIEENANIAESYIENNIPKLKVVKPEGTFLLWIDCRGTGLTDKEIWDRLINIGKLVVSQGNSFGPGGEGFIRMNIACPQERLMQGLSRLKKAFDK